MTVYSHSKLASFEQCRYKYKLKYIDKVPSPVEKSIEAHLGTCVHDSLEWLYTEVQKGNLPTLDDVLEKYVLTWQEGWVENILIVKTNVTAEDYKTKGVQFLIDYYIKHQPFKDGTISMEEKVWVDLARDYPHKLIGYIDRLVHNKETGEYEIHDYKTANSLPSQEKFDKDRQLALYSIAIKEKYGKDKPVLLTWHYLNHNKQIFSKRTNEQLDELKKEIMELIETVEHAKIFPTQKTILCNWCEYKTYCKAFGNKLPEKYREQQMKLFKDEIKEEYPSASKYIKSE
ncbi:MAG: PD-(D/E)XK nuclease family protein [Nanoarchaeota archaeon]|jgi:RecB family exonuclease|nr:PD-(D/E)XK nuclease family protein [Nanoarchaeota archaeon]